MNLSSPYPKVPSPAPYDVQFSDNTCVTDDRDSFLLLQLANIKYRTELNWTDDSQTTCQRLDLTIGQKLANCSPAYEGSQGTDQDVHVTPGYGPWSWPLAAQPRTELGAVTRPRFSTVEAARGNGYARISNAARIIRDSSSVFLPHQQRKSIDYGVFTQATWLSDDCVSQCSRQRRRRNTNPIDCLRVLTHRQQKEHLFARSKTRRVRYLLQSPNSHVHRRIQYVTKTTEWAWLSE